MIRERLGPALVTPHPERDGTFRWRGDGVSRIEGLRDAVFGFALTLLVGSLGAPPADYVLPTRPTADRPSSHA